MIAPMTMMYHPPRKGSLMMRKRKTAKVLRQVMKRKRRIAKLVVLSRSMEKMLMIKTKKTLKTRMVAPNQVMLKFMLTKMMKIKTTTVQYKISRMMKTIRNQVARIMMKLRMTTWRKNNLNSS